MSTTPYFVVMLDYRHLGREAIVNPNHDWNDTLGLVEDAAADGQIVHFVHEMRDGVVRDRSEEAYQAICTRLANENEPLTDAQFGWVEKHISMQAAASFRRVA